MNPSKLEAALDEIRNVCRKHNIQLTPQQYDGLQVWDLTPGEDPLHFPGIDDRTKGEGSPHDIAAKPDHALLKRVAAEAWRWAVDGLDDPRNGPPEKEAPDHVLDGVIQNVIIGGA